MKTNNARDVLLFVTPVFLAVIAAMWIIETGTAGAGTPPAPQPALMSIPF